MRDNSGLAVGPAAEQIMMPWQQRTRRHGAFAQVILASFTEGELAALTFPPCTRHKDCDGGFSTCHLPAWVEPLAEPECIHPGVFATGRPAEHCWTCGRDVPAREL